VPDLDQIRPDPAAFKTDQAPYLATQSPFIERGYIVTTYNPSSIQFEINTKLRTINSKVLNVLIARKETSG